MAPHALFVSSDRSVDLVLQLLTLVVIGGLLASMAAFVYSWIYPSAAVKDRGDVGPPEWAAMSEVLLAAPHVELDVPLQPRPSHAIVYRCDYRGEITFSDRPCALGQVRALKLRPS